MPSVLIVDDHVAIRAGLCSVLRLNRRIDVAATAGDAAGALEALERRPVDVALVDYRLPDADGLALCRRVKSRFPGVRVVLYTAVSECRLVVAAVVAGADGLLNKGAPADEVIRGIEAAATGGTAFPALPPDVVRECSARLDQHEMAILGLRIEGTPEDEIADTLRCAPRAVAAEIEAIVARLKPDGHVAEQRTEVLW